MTNVDRDSRCIVGWDVVYERDYDHLQPLLDRSPQATRYYSDAFAVYQTLVYYPGHHQSLPDKSQTYSVEADNAELRHYLARLTRKSRCFSRSVHALWRAVKLFVFAWNRRQLYKCAFPSIPLMSATLYTLDLCHSRLKLALARVKKGSILLPTRANTH